MNNPEFQVTPEQVERLSAMLDILEARHRRYCPRCNHKTLWWNNCRDGIHTRFQCNSCGLQECDLLTEQEWANEQAKGSAS